ncbi:MAG: MBL fold metallo-hydrolase [Rhodothermia bacterium]
MLLLPLGESDLIGASCYYVNIDGTGILLDAGQSPMDDGPDGLPSFDLLNQNPDWAVDHVVITHAHHDHIGALPHLARKWPHASVHMTNPTRHLLDTLLPASARLQARKAKERGYDSGVSFSEEELEAVSYQYRSYGLNEEFDLTGLLGGSNVRGTFYHSGHVLGAAGILIEFEENRIGRTLFYTSDTNVNDQTIHPAGEYPESPIDVLMLESTLGADPHIEHTTRDAEELALGEAIQSVIDRGGRVLLPVFALGRAQEILALIDRFKNVGMIDADVPVYTAGMMRGIADIYDRTRFSSPRLDEEFEVYGVPQKRLPKSKAGTANALQQQAIHIAASGMMLENTLSNRLAQKLMDDPDSGIFFVGFVKDDAPGHRLLHAAEHDLEVSLAASHEPQPVRCEVRKFRLTGHSTRRDLLELAGRLDPKTVALVHGETEAKDWMEDNLRYFYPAVPVLRPEQGVALNL